MFLITKKWNGIDQHKISWMKIEMNKIGKIVNLNNFWYFPRVIFSDKQRSAKYVCNRIKNIDMASNLWKPPKSLNENKISIGDSEKKRKSKRNRIYFFKIKKNKTMLEKYIKIKNILNDLIKLILNFFSRNIKMVPNKPLLTKPSL